jgi:hypothetical protein
VLLLANLVQKNGLTKNIQLLKRNLQAKKKGQTKKVYP